MAPSTIHRLVVPVMRGVTVLKRTRASPGAEHMLLTRIALAQNNKEVAESTKDFTKYPLAASIDTNVASMISGSDIERFAASRAISNMWGPYTSTDSSNEAAFYFAACNVSSPQA